MSNGWIIAAVLAVVAIGQFVVYKKLQAQLKSEKIENANLVSRLTETEQELVDVKARRKKLLSASTQALIIVESDFTVSSANKEARRLFGKPARDASLMAWTRQHQLQDLVDRTLQGEKMPALYLNYSERTLEAHARSIKEHKEIVAVALAITDITEIQKLTRARRDFVTNISHEIRNPLASIQLLVDTLLNGGLDDREIAYDLSTKIATQVDALSQMAQEVLDLSMIESGKVPLKMANHQLLPIVQAQVERYLPQAERKNLSVEVNIDQELQVLVDERMIGRVISNLIHNSIKFTDQGGMTISAQKLNEESPEDPDGPSIDWVAVTVADTGVGIAPDEIPRIFERFYKVDRARNRQESGTGLGLAIARYIVEAHGGKIWADKNGAGATFHFTVPSE
ncbi:MAG: Adaptive-response sensory-kinase SasA [Anaerolineae bacterium]|nr:Adaptive-response sensory-kinase SasA [Anaerolineae bacterium]